MNKNLLVTFAIVIAFPCFVIGQVWPLNIPNLPTSCSPSMNNTATCTKTAVLNNGDWKNPNTWSPVGVPGVDAIVCIPRNITVEVNTPTYDAVSTLCGNTFTNNSNTPRLAIFVCGTIDFKAGGKLNLGCGSALSILPTTGRVLAANGNSDQIQIGDKVVWGGANNQNINSPANVTYGGIGQGVLAVTFKQLEARLQTPFEAVIKWSTISEVNSKVFVLEKSTDAANWTVVESVSAKGDNSTETFYTVIDKNIADGITYYRVKEIDNESKVTYSAVASVVKKRSGKIVVYPNPASSNATLYMSDAIGRNQTIQLYNMNGTFIQNLRTSGSNVLQFSTTDLSPGVYLIRVVENGKTITETKLIKQ